MKSPIKRKYSDKYDDIKQWKDADQITIEYLEEYTEASFGKLFNYVNSQLEKNDQYSRKGYSLRLETLREKGTINRKSYKQGHFRYFLTKKGEDDIFLKTKTLQEISHGLLKIHFAEPLQDSEKYFLNRTITRIGFYMLYSCIQGLKNTSQKNSHKKNIQFLQEWGNGINPASGIYNYLGELVENFSKIDPKEEFLPIIKSKNKMKKILQFEKILEEAYHKEYLFCNTRVIDYPEKIKDFEENGKKLPVIFDAWIKNLNKKMEKESKITLKENECPRCHYDGVGKIKNGPYKGDENIFQGYKEHGPDKGEWCDLCHYNIDNDVE